jgi:hypothetical protein
MPKYHPPFLNCLQAEDCVNNILKVCSYAPPPTNPPKYISITYIRGVYGGKSLFILRTNDREILRYKLYV